MLTLFGASAVTFMMVMYGLERRHRLFVLAFAIGCALIWALIALRRYVTLTVGRPIDTGLRR